MKKCVNCGFESKDETLSCPSCSTDTFTSASPEALGHIISPEEQRFWERMTFRQFAVFLIRLQALYLFVEAINYATYLLDYICAYYSFYTLCVVGLLRYRLSSAMGVICIGSVGQDFKLVRQRYYPKNTDEIR